MGVSGGFADCADEETANKEKDRIKHERKSDLHWVIGSSPR